VRPLQDVDCAGCEAGHEDREPQDVGHALLGAEDLHERLLEVQDVRLYLASDHGREQSLVSVLNPVAQLDEELDVAADRVVVRERRLNAAAQLPGLRLAVHFTNRRPSFSRYRKSMPSRRN
jgi:hypothetical protein